MDASQAKAKWNEKYQKQELSSFGAGPSEWLFEHRELLHANIKAMALDIACGNGRNSFFLAQLGYELDAVDISDVVVERVRREAEEKGLAVHARCVDVAEWPFPKGEFGVILNFNFLERRIFAKMKAALAPGGLLFFETFMADPDHNGTGGMNPKFQLRTNELLEEFKDLRVLHYRESRDGKLRLRAGMVAQKR